MKGSEGGGPNLPPAALLLLERGWSLAVAESCTGGLIMKQLTDSPGSSRYLAGGVVAYADAVKVALLDVAPATLESFGAVSREVAMEMAAGVAARLGTETGLAVTGIAGPGGGAEEKPVGTVWFGCTVQGRTVAEGVHLDGGREAIRAASAEVALDLLARTIAGGAPPLIQGRTPGNPGGIPESPGNRGSQPET